MVYKVSKGGVRSGNTLRCTSSVKAKRYSRQACIVTRSNLYPEEITKFLDSSEDSLVNSTLASTDVILSLNKKARWRVPAEISHMIQSGHFNKGKTMVSFLERHKLKRTANCIRFISNQERLGQVVPRHRKYFSFNLNNIDRDQSNRQLKHQKEESKEQSSKIRLMTDRRKGIMKTIEVFTVSGSGKAEDVQKSLVSSKPEYRIEVFHPSPKSCSLTYNPKYTDVHMEFGHDGKMEIKSNGKPTKGTSRHRKRFSLKDLRLYEDELNANGEQEVWYDENDEYDSDEFLELEDVSILTNKNEHRTLVSCSENDSCNETGLNECNNEMVLKENQTQVFDNTIAGFIVQAEKKSHTRNLVGQKNKHFYRHSKEQTCTSGFNDKSHIVHINETNGNEAQDSVPSNFKTPESAQVILKTSEISPEKLKSKFGWWYQEGSSEPRRFTINMTEDVNNLLKPTNDLEHEGTFIAHLVFVHADHFDENLEFFKVSFNSNLCTDNFIASKEILSKEMSIDEITNLVVCCLMDMKLNNQLSDDYTHPFEDNSVAKLVHKCLMENTTDSYKSLEVLGNFHVTEDTANVPPHVGILKDLDYDLSCDNCYESINAGSISWTRLLGCRHVYCDECWQSHLYSRLKKGNVKLTCPGSNCEVFIDLVTLLSLLHVSEVSKLLVLALEDDQSSADWKLCPTSDCGRIVRHVTAKDSKYDVLCCCGHTFCFLCLSEPHWPCDCKQAEKYLEEIRKLKLIKVNHLDLEDNILDSETHEESREERVFEIESRICPKCSDFIEKDGGCSHMICKCGHEFCWKCALAWDTHNIWKCDPSEPYVLKYTQKVTVRHLENPKLFTLEGESLRPQADACQQKATRYNNALEQRLEAKKNFSEKQIQEIVKQIQHIAQRGFQNKKEILNICGVETSDMVGSKLDGYPLLPPVKKFLRSCQDSKRAVHHMAEFTFVLLKDITASAEKRKASRLLQDLLGYCSFMKSVFEMGPDLDLLAAIRHLADIRRWSKRSMAALVSCIEKMK